MAKKKKKIRGKETDFLPFGAPASGDAILNEDGTGDHILLETATDHILLEGAAAAIVEYRRRLIIAS